MEGVFVFLYVVVLVWSILCIILFFKVWGMCNNVRRILQFLIDNEIDNGEVVCERSSKRQSPNEKVSSSNNKKTKDVNKRDKDDKEYMKQMMAFNDDCMVFFKKCDSRKDFEHQVDSIVTKYEEKGYDFSDLKDGLWEQFNSLYSV